MISLNEARVIVQVFHHAIDTADGTPYNLDPLQTGHLDTCYENARSMILMQGRVFLGNKNSESW